MGRVERRGVSPGQTPLDDLRFGVLLGLSVHLAC